MDEALADNDAEAEDEGDNSARETSSRSPRMRNRAPAKPKAEEADNSEPAKAARKPRKPKGPNPWPRMQTRSRLPAQPKPAMNRNTAGGAQVVSLEAFRKRK